MLAEQSRAGGKEARGGKAARAGKEEFRQASYRRVLTRDATILRSAFAELPLVPINCERNQGDCNDPQKNIFASALFFFFGHTVK
jgi:hypothetical protein